MFERKSDCVCVCVCVFVRDREMGKVRGERERDVEFSD